MTQPSMLFWNIGSVGRPKNAWIVTVKIDALIAQYGRPQVICFAEVVITSSAYEKIKAHLLALKYNALEPDTQGITGKKDIVMFTDGKPAEIGSVRNGIACAKIGKYWYVGFHFPRSTPKAIPFENEFSDLHNDPVAGQALAVGDHNDKTEYLTEALYAELPKTIGDDFTFAPNGQPPSLLDGAFKRGIKGKEFVVIHDDSEWWTKEAGGKKKARLDHSFVLAFGK